jgi:hypothetical protein
MELITKRGVDRQDRPRRSPPVLYKAPRSRQNQGTAERSEGEVARRLPASMQPSQG